MKSMFTVHLKKLLLRHQHTLAYFCVQNIAYHFI